MFPRMIFRVLAAALVALAASVMVADAEPVVREHDRGERATVIVELYTSQGCTECTRANRLLGRFGREDGVLALTFPVGIWDYLGWSDTLAKPVFNDRQRAYQRSLRVRGRFTPQLVVNGASTLSASDWDEARAALERARVAPTPEAAPEVLLTRLRGDVVRIALGARARTGPADVWLVAYDPGPISVYVSRGLSPHRTVTHYNVAMDLQRAGTWTGASTYLERSDCSPECAVIVQEPNGGPVIAAAFTRRPPR